MNYSSSRHRLWIILFLMALISLGTGLCYWQMQKKVDKDIQSRLQQAIASLDVTVSHAEQAADLAEPFMGKNCNENVLTELRTLVATIPDVRSVNLGRDNEIYCTSVFGGRKFQFDRTQYTQGSLQLFQGNDITPSHPLMVYSEQDDRGNTTLIGIDGYYLYNILSVLDGDAHLYLQVGNRVMNRKGEVTTTPKIKIPVRLTSEQFNYSVIADRGFASGAVAFIRYEQHTLIAILLASLLLAFLFRNYLRYRQTIEYQLRKAIELKQLKPYIQPIINDEDGAIIGGEVLVRWEHPKQGFIAPDKFISVAEQTGLIKDVTAICFAEVSRQLRRQQSLLPKGLFICFNTSSVNFQDDEIVQLCQTFIQELKEAEVRLVLEITERESIENTLQTSEVTDKLRRIGIQFSLDDFGTGYANYSYIQQFNPEIIKIDKVFTFNIITNNASALVVKNMVNLAKKFNCQIIAEGVEDKEQLTMLRKMGIAIYQGYYFSQPVPVGEFIKMLPRSFR
ncbi:PAS/PAC sensor-containing diguanylate cyclase/phosphodiesterase [Klebsiella oxytoca]|uniref:EAL domain-containing protein n=1 Tax=Klebsiella oxytoca TaxID=571 RepID=UPI0007CD300A|nr:cyclic diguanylate phosphodiesterase [Klebsiella oxytoca]MBG2598118.1 cyclic diguanylate phosphodiesterase [Klebsiella oxytoca]SAQ36828.1 PAS/PAC sensor-containing diguanylate cyclase/phosphodiesterase [Klebsiella oxytoca]SBL58373.1 PAS/PAC sensor-containing diguanylate cyclase/phosphodiesterase [Klebsiella oxytoca]SBL65637.1 PAS/PAC sensor-containing diguanylate cyclase/phosphodiesterase [Klebsiella oxytoca]HCF8095008.1 cyclic diguanylate phosphodiesterase [Klebsiella oxytoca]